MRRAGPLFHTREWPYIHWAHDRFVVLLLLSFFLFFLSVFLSFCSVFLFLTPCPPLLGESSRSTSICQKGGGDRERHGHRIGVRGADTKSGGQEDTHTA